jgi:hypothetical protein
MASPPAAATPLPLRRRLAESRCTQRFSRAPGLARELANQRARRTRCELVEESLHREKVAEAVHALGVDAQLPRRLRAAQHHDREDRERLRRQAEDAPGVVRIAHDAPAARLHDQRQAFRWSIAPCTSSSVAWRIGSRLLFWLQPAVSALRVSGYVSGTVRSFSRSTPRTRVSRRESAGRELDMRGPF